MVVNFKHKSAIASAALFAALSSTAFSQVEGEKTAAAPELMSPYASVSTRYYNVGLKDKDADTRIHVRPIVGFKFLDEKFKLETVNYFNRSSGSVDVDYSGSDVYLFGPAATLGAVELQPYYLQTLNSEKSTSKHAVGGTVEAARTFDNIANAGALKLSADLDMYAAFSSKEETAKIVAGDEELKTRETLSLTASEDGTTKKTNPDIEAEAGLNAAFTPSLVKDLTVQVRSAALPTWNEKFVVKGEETESKYARTDITYQRLRLNYKLTDNLSVRNETYMWQSGLYKSALKTTTDDEKTLENVLQLNYNFL